MLFSSLVFLFGFLPIFLACYFLAPARFKNHALLAASVAFYVWGAPRFLPAVLALSWVDLLFSRWIHSCRASSAARRRLLGAAVSLNLSLLFYYKYANFFFEEGDNLLGALGLPLVHWGHVALPMGISFIVFEEISYLADVYRGRTPPADGILTYWLFLLMFPHSIAGPIFRWHDLEAQLKKRAHSAEDFLAGFMRFAAGLAKKVLIADCMAETADLAFSIEPSRLPASYAWAGILAYALEIYFDFSGYSDMAIGLGRMLGFRFKENFNRPYLADSIRDFWKRWHISLSTWMLDYLYIPLGGNRGSAARTYLNLWTVFLLCGLWHGARWTFVAWGIYHGSLLVLDRAFWSTRVAPRLPRPVNVLLTFLSVLIGWAFFRSPDIHAALVYIGRLLFLSSPAGGVLVSRGELMSNRAAFFMAAGLFLSFAPDLDFSWTAFPATGTRYAVGLALVALAASALLNCAYHPFLYFVF